jgi:hypothetical protein
MIKFKPIPQNPVSWLRAAFWTGAIVDAKAFLLFFFPSFLPAISKAVFNWDIPGESDFALLSLRRLVAIFDLAWTLLLIWAAHKPVERKGVMLLTVFPILTGILILRFLSCIYTNVSIAYSITNGVFVILFIFFAFSYLVNCRWFAKGGNK